MKGVFRGGIWFGGGEGRGSGGGERGVVDFGGSGQWALVHGGVGVEGVGYV